jgi:ribosomal protein L11 methyltransferase
VKHYPALDLQSANLELLYAALDEFSPTAIEEHDDNLRAFFLTAEHRNAAHRALAATCHVSAIDVSDEDWARRSQEGLQPVTVGRISIVPNRQSAIADESAIRNPQSAIVVIQPSMGFGTGHHATTRLCLSALQQIDVRGKTVLDVGTGSGILAIAARALGAARTTGIDVDPDAIQSARENLELNPGISSVSFSVTDLETADVWGQTPDISPDIVTANLTGALLTRTASRLLDATATGGHLILSGLMTSERDEVVAAFRRGTVVWERSEDEWVGLAVKKP